MAAVMMQPPQQQHHHPNQHRLLFEDLVFPEAQDIHFEFEDFLQTDLNLTLTHDKAGALAARQLRLSRGKSVVCKHWLRGLCKKGDLCEFLHEFNLKKMPECWFFQRLGECTNPECQYLHIDPATKMKECTWYSRGFCIHGPQCRGKHVRKGVCQNYLTGFCPKGPECPFGHPKFEVHTLNAVLAPGEIQPQIRQHRSLDDVVCFKCGEKGHYANTCRLSATAMRGGSNERGGGFGGGRGRGRGGEHSPSPYGGMDNISRPIPTFTS
ncbi:hypothetical protein SmJEL517_g02320 [Synchytrium microbalum]|uniref:mRNA 3'-end-processing protein n=1 Tax=Synchytrium microbalum TaxID=1806994 RepID=A0A507C7B0_9FUNG|nr:uncharacterized protein SmJEL517_g02320 [Synchytrium microbalum]TPX35218.1 hypothetical protein SmJEL517_g02320 [Synchytrium microbalum]